MDNEKTVKVLNSLIEINNDRIEGYDIAKKETEESDLKDLFTRLSSTSNKCKAELVAEVHKLSGTPTEGTKVSGKFFRVWMDVKAALTGKDRKVILDSCEFGEDKAVEVYDKVLKDDIADLNPAQKDMVTRQRRLIEDDHDTVKRLRDAAKAARS
jgi:hypothetical protein